MPLPCYERVVLEMSLKPFRQLDADFIQSVCERVFENWRALVQESRELCILLWVGDGSEILLWRGDLNEPIERAESIGFCNYQDVPLSADSAAYPPGNRHYRINQAVPYMPHPPKICFGDLRAIIQGLRAAARRCLGKSLSIGATLDPGPEFVHSSFKFRTHREVLIPDCQKKAPMMMHFLTHQARLRADPAVYAGFPNGIPEGASFGEFLGRQFTAAAAALGYDYIWFSNGFGYSHFPWGVHGEAFLGTKFDAAQAHKELEALSAFWTDFRRHCKLPVEVRGTNFTVGMDISTDGCSHLEVTRLGGLQRPPCNPPWGSRALGLEMSSYLSRIAKTTPPRIPFRFYLNDPWFVSRPWYDYYHRETFDIYVPLAASRLSPPHPALSPLGRGWGEGCAVETPSDLSLLTIDDAHGELRADQAAEVTPQLLRAAEERADAAGPLVWVYPFDEYHAALSGVDDSSWTKLGGTVPRAKSQELRAANDRLAQPFAHDWFVTQALNAGLPLNTVCSSETFQSLAESGKLPPSVYFAPIVAEGNLLATLLKHVQNGGQALLYGSPDHATPELLEALGLQLDKQGLEGDFQVESRIQEDRFARNPQPPASGDVASAAIGLAVDSGGRGKNSPAERLLRHRALISGGALRAVAAAWDDPDLRLLVRQQQQTRAYALCRARPQWQGGRLAWIESTVAFDPISASLEPVFDPPWQFRVPCDWPRRLLADFGLDIRNERLDETVRPANVFVKRRDGGWIFVGHKPDTSTRFWVRFPDGAPAYEEAETPIVAGCAGESFGKSFHNEVRAFVRMNDGIVQVKHLPRPLGKQRCFCVSNLSRATVTLYPSPQALAKGSLELGRLIRENDVRHEIDRQRGTATVRDYTGSLYVMW